MVLRETLAAQGEEHAEVNRPVRSVRSSGKCAACNVVMKWEGNLCRGKRHVVGGIPVLALKARRPVLRRIRVILLLPPPAPLLRRDAAMERWKAPKSAMTVTARMVTDAPAIAQKKQRRLRVLRVHQAVDIVPKE